MSFYPINFNWPTISIVTPSYNQGRYLEECIDSILSQNYPNLEYIIMDGGSTDNSIEIIKKYSHHLSHWQSIPDQGQYFAINEGLKHTSGKIMTWLNSDDRLYKNSLKIAAVIFTLDNEIKWITGRPNLLNEELNEVFLADFIPIWSRQKYLTVTYDQPCCIQQEGTFWTRALWNRAGGYLNTELSLAADLELWVRFFRHSQLFSLEIPTGCFRYHPEQKSQIYYQRYKAEADEVIREEIQRYKQGIDPVSMPAPEPIYSDDVKKMLESV